MEAIKSLNIAIRFLLEICLLISAGYIGYKLTNIPYVKYGLAISIPILVACIWGIFIAPKASYLLNVPYRIFVEIVLFGLTCVLLALYGKIGPAIALGLAFSVNEMLLLYWKQ
ncbi:MAG: YrdB family protein [Candidatus Nomurabacteria bacterium]|nr:MAG: YrdB family protein [Candidatus Nomurabacteria bacterium]